MESRLRLRVSFSTLLFIVLICHRVAWMIKIVQNIGQAGEDPSLNLAEVQFFHHTLQLPRRLFNFSSSSHLLTSDFEDHTSGPPEAANDGDKKTIFHSGAQDPEPTLTITTADDSVVFDKIEIWNRPFTSADDHDFYYRFNGSTIIVRSSEGDAAATVFHAAVNSAEPSYTFLVHLNNDAVRTRSRIGVFILGDSTGMRLMRDGMAQVYNCFEADNRTSVPLETIFYHKPGFYTLDSGLVCRDSYVSRIGYMLHWGVNQMCCNYFASWKDHRSPEDYTDNVENIKRAVREFQHRSELDDGAIFLYNSNLWDVHHYVNNPDNMDLAEFVRDFRSKYAAMVKLILSMLRPGSDRLVLQLSHHLHPTAAGKTEFSKLLNTEIMHVAARFSLKTFRADLTAGLFHQRDNNYLEDLYHQNSRTSVAFAEHFHRIVVEEEKEQQETSRSRHPNPT